MPSHPSEQSFWGMSFADFCKAHPRENFEALRPRYLAIQEENKWHNALVRHKYLRRLEADKAQKQRERQQAAEQAALEREAEVKRQFRYRYSTLTEAQYDAFWPDIYKEFLLAEANRVYAEMRREVVSMPKEDRTLENVAKRLQAVYPDEAPASSESLRKLISRFELNWRELRKGQ